MAHLLHFLLLLQITCKKPVPSFTSTVQRRESSKGIWKTVINPVIKPVIKPVASCYIPVLCFLACLCPLKSVPAYIPPSSNPGWASHRRQWHLGGQEGPCQFYRKMGKFWRNHSWRGIFCLETNIEYMAVLMGHLTLPKGDWSGEINHPPPLGLLPAPSLSNCCIGETPTSYGKLGQAAALSLLVGMGKI